MLPSDLGYNNIGHHNNHVTKSPHVDEFFSTGLELNHSFSHKWWCACAASPPASSQRGQAAIACM
jgi:hypothetical protein